MTLFLTMLPFYLLGNLHCIGMCGPLVMMIGQHRFRHFYFFGRTLSFGLAGLMAGELGAILQNVLRQYHIGAATSFLFGGIIFVIGLYSLLGWQPPSQQWIAGRFETINRTLSLLMLRDRAWPTFLFGFFTVALPCGQTIIVFSACALAGDAWVGLLNGIAFALLTSPSLLLAMHAHNLLRNLRPYYNRVMGLCAICIGILAIFRGLAEIEMIPHLILNPEYHIVLY